MKRDLHIPRLPAKGVMNKNLALAVLLLVCGLCGLLSLFFVLLWAPPIRLPWDSTKYVPSVPPMALLLDLSSLPSATIIQDGPGRQPEELAVSSDDSAYVAFSIPNAPESASHTVFWYRSISVASYEFGTLQRIAFDERTARGGWYVPPGWTFKGATADDSEFRCADTQYIPANLPLIRCTAVVRYGQYVSVFTTPLVPGILSVSDIENILRDIDRRMAQLAKQAP